MLCYKGMCSKSICVNHGLKPCECKKREEECHACCIKDDICQSAYKIDEVINRVVFKRIVLKI